ncbi:transglycosylase domain-containing protein [Flavobacteriaceae bacterium]|uniref:penicillin-binding protein 1A n=1 Tax=Candidatus Arcticimaribacter forsetii TaxID=2820661 RepID=UPI00207718AD|nr:transglycosylase domain-containing protein [Candidatus Arcticimaribacter forsetii]MDA8698670.1 transglycosylase domain-containing protein [Flavobacteriaceae bacterium]MDB2346180.1 transglycosylase domain-containing protein [Flavobacteriaceae bacterium]MDB4673969.1 transglycosylase domain-containing protein [Flavobacteriaceae bacterium]MDB4716594.1 transglycosylase domain-containing protein [Flavobacteriaceae bacterium]
MAAKQNKTKSKNKKAKPFKGLVRVFWLLFVTGLLSFSSLFVIAALGYLGEMPDLEQLENPKTKLATQIISSDGVVLGKFYVNDNRTPISYEALPTNLVNALIATEDERFFTHSGIDLKGTLRAIFYLGKKGGASTISQQLARQLFVGVRSRNKTEALLQKFKEWVLAVKLERSYTKKEIIAMYLNVYDFGYSGDGIQSASKIYFNTTPQKLSIEQSATLVGMLKNSSYFNPIRRASRVEQRRNVVLQQMERNGFITESERDSIKQIPLKIDYTPDSHREGLATYFRAYLQQFMRSWTKNNPKADGTNYDIFRDGLRIYTTIDSRLQEIGETSVSAHMSNLQEEFFLQNTPEANPTAPFLDLREGEIDTLLQNTARRSERWRKMRLAGKDEETIWASFKKPVEMEVFSWKGDLDTLMTPLDSIRYYKHFLRASMMSMDPKTGHVKAWVGGFNYKHFQYDQVYQGRRQIGSTFKPFLYATAIDQLRLSPCDILPDALFCIEPLKHGNVDAWCPKNSGNKYGQMRTLKNALANSVNTVSARLMDKVGPRPVINLARKMGITSYLPRVPSIALGTPDISLLEMVGAYSTFANKGIYVKPIMITRIEDKNGTVLFEVVPETTDVLSEESAYVTIDLLKGVTEAGSGIRLRHEGADQENYAYQNVVTGYPYKFENPIAGKTGTTQNQSDGWFMGMVPNLVTGVWVGGEDRAVHFEDIAFGQGATMALPIWAMYMRGAYEIPELGISLEDFEAPEKLTIPINCDQGKTLNDVTKEVKKEDDLEDLGF